jgi:hypothetical protein
LYGRGKAEIITGAGGGVTREGVRRPHPGDGRDDVIAGAGPGAGPHVKVFSGADGSLLSSFMAFAPSFSGGVVVGALDANGDGRADVAAAAQQGPAQVRLVDGLTLAELDSFFAFWPALDGGAVLSCFPSHGERDATAVKERPQRSRPPVPRAARSSPTISSATDPRRPPWSTTVSWRKRASCRAWPLPPSISPPDRW